MRLHTHECTLRMRPKNLGRFHIRNGTSMVDVNRSIWRSSKLHIPSMARLCSALPVCQAYGAIASVFTATLM